MRKANQAVNKVFLPPSQMNWTDEKLAGLSKEQLITLLENLQTQRDAGRVTAQAAEDLTRLITGRLPAGALTPRRKRARAQVLLEGRVAEELAGLATSLESRYDLSSETAKQQSSGVKGFKAQTLTDRRGAPRAGASMKDGRMAIDRYISYRVRDAQASLAFLLFPGEPEASGRYVLLATDDLLDGEPLSDAYAPLARAYGWAEEALDRMRAAPTTDFAEAQQRYESLIARLAPARV
jgi:hypothetical protein